MELPTWNTTTTTPNDCPGCGQEVRTAALSRPGGSGVELVNGQRWSIDCLTAAIDRDLMADEVVRVVAES